MAIVSGGLIRSYGATVNHIINGGQITSTSFSVAADIDTAFPNTDGYPFCDVVLTLTKAAAGTAGLGVKIYMRALNIVSTNDSNEPDASFRWEEVRFLPTDSVATEQFLEARNIDIPSAHAIEFYVENLTGQTINNTWELDIMPWTWATQP